MKHSKKKKKRPNEKTHVESSAKKDEEKLVVETLLEAFSSASLEEATFAYREANGDPSKAADILGAFTAEEKVKGGTFSCSSSSSGSSSCNWDKAREKKKKVIASTGMVSSVIAKDYLFSKSPKKDSKFKGYDYEPVNKVDAEQFLCSMLGEDCELGLPVVRDVLCECGYDVQKALNKLLDFCASSYECSENGQTAESFAGNKEETGLIFEYFDNLTDRTSDSTSHTSESDSQDSELTAGYRRRNYSEVLTGSGVQSKVGMTYSKSELPQEVLKSLFNMPKRSELDPKAMSWKNVAKKLESLGQRFECAPPNVAETELVHAKGDEYHVFRTTARQHWDVMKLCYNRAAAAFSNGEREYASYLSEQGRLSNKMAREADERASKEIFRARNKSIENVITIDLHGQHVKQAMRLLKVHLLFGAYACSVQIFRVITGCGGSQGMGKSKLKQSVIDLVEREGIEWKEENRGTILIRLDGQREFAFMELEEDDD